jgi:hypothetical protein
MPISFKEMKVLSPTPGILFTGKGAKKSLSLPGCTKIYPFGFASSVAIFETSLLDDKDDVQEIEKV